MLKVVFLLVPVLAQVSPDYLSPDYFAVPPAGKCRDDIVPISFDLYAAVSVLQWRILYGPDSPSYADVNTVCRNIFDVIPNGVVQAFDRFIMKDNSKIAYFFTVQSGRDNTIIETSVVGYCGNRQRKRFRLYILDVATPDNAVLFYRCSDDGREDIDSRFMAIPKANNLSAASEQRLLSKDKTFGFKGNIKKYRSKCSC